MVNEFLGQLGMRECGDGITAVQKRHSMRGGVLVPPPPPLNNRPDHSSTTYLSVNRSYWARVPGRKSAVMAGWNSHAPLNPP